jgi:hypothetical protein
MKCVFFISVLLNSILCCGQIVKHNWLVGGNLNYSSYETNENGVVAYKAKRLEGTANVGYFLLNKVASGLQVNDVFGKSYYKEPNGNFSGVAQNKISFGPFARYYFLNLSNRVNLIGEGSFCYGVFTTSPTQGANNSQNSFQYSFFGGPVVFLNSSVAMELMLGFTRDKSLDKDVFANTIKVKVGFQFYFEKE